MFKALLIILLVISPLAYSDSKSSQKISVKIKDGDLILTDVLNNISEISQIKPSKGVAKIAGNIVDIKNVKYELRLFYYEDTNNNLDLNFLEFCKLNNLLELKSKIMNEGYGKIEFFSSRHVKDLKKKGIYFLLSMRKVD